MGNPQDSIRPSQDQIPDIDPDVFFKGADPASDGTVIRKDR